MKMRVREKWRYGRERNGEVKVLEIEKINQKECKEEYERRMTERLDESAIIVGM